jgi:hypothetical protein
MKAQQTIKDPKGLDRALMALRTSIASTCDWLDNVYGEAEALRMGGPALTESTRSGSSSSTRRRALVVYDGLNEYIQCMPDPRVGSFTCFYVDGLTGSEVKTGSNPAMHRYSADIALICFFNYDTAFPDDAERKTVRHVEEQLLTALTNTSDRQLAFEYSGTITRFDQVFAPAQMATTDPILSRRPYGYLRIEGRLTYNPTMLACYDG